MTTLAETPSLPTHADLPTTPLLFLRRFCTAQKLGRGVCTFEDTEVIAKAFVKLAITFENGRTLTGGLVFFAGLGVHFNGKSLIDLPIERARLNDHHGAAGFSCDEKAAVAILQGKSRWVA